MVRLYCKQLNPPRLTLPYGPSGSLKCEMNSLERVFGCTKIQQGSLCGRGRAPSVDKKNLF